MSAIKVSDVKKGEVLLQELKNEGLDYQLVYLIDSHTRDNIIGDDSVAGFVFIKDKEEYKVYNAYQTVGQDRNEFSGLAVDLNCEENIKFILEIIKDENEYECIFGVENCNNRSDVKKLINNVENK
ncbi:hypothetical protein [Bacillus cereus]|uniref:hypothetical protein n=1 Tax=Bacillus cereus TaxID=1396 RepID=UPI000B4B36CF|nr:hypothetical protein [Bacillus cereus]